MASSRHPLRRAVAAAVAMLTTTDGRTLRDHYGRPRPASAYAARELVTT